MIGSMNTKVNINLRKLAIRLLAGSGAVVLLSAVTLSEVKAANELHAAHEALDVVPAVEFVHHAGATHTADVDAVHELVAVFNTTALVGKAAEHVAETHAAIAHHTDDVDILHIVLAEEVDGFHAVHIAEVDGARPAVHTSVAVHLSGGLHATFNVTDAGRVFEHAAFRALGDADVALPTPRAIDAGYVRHTTGIDLFGAPKDWHSLAARYGYYVSDKPVPGGVVCFEGGAYGSSEAYGFVGVVVYYQERGDHWEVVTRYAYPAEGRGHGGNYVKEQSFRVLKNDPRAHYIYRGGSHARPGGYYTRPEYVGHNVVGEEYAFKGEAKDVVAVHPENGHGRTYVRPGQVVRVLAKAEVGETLWVFVETPYRAGAVYAVTHYGTRLVRYDGASPEASRMYYAKDYGDTVLDLGYADYSRIAGDSGEITITVKKGDNPAHLLPLQTVRLQLGGK